MLDRLRQNSTDFLLIYIDCCAIIKAHGPKTTYYNHVKEVNDMLYIPREEGQGLVEYALIIVLVAIVVIVALSLLGPVIGDVFSSIANTLEGTG
jgi:pilus assembly protein Flp/PilA